MKRKLKIKSNLAKALVVALLMNTIVPIPLEVSAALNEGGYGTGNPSNGGTVPTSSSYWQDAQGVRVSLFFIPYSMKIDEIAPEIYSEFDCKTPDYMQNMHDNGQMTESKLSILDQHKAVQVAPTYDIMLDDGTSVSVFNN